MMIDLEALHARRRDLTEMIKAHERGSMRSLQGGGGRRLLVATVDLIAAFKIEIADIELYIIVAGGTLPRCD